MEDNSAIRLFTPAVSHSIQKAKAPIGVNAALWTPPPSMAPLYKCPVSRKNPHMNTSIQGRGLHVACLPSHWIAIYAPIDSASWPALHATHRKQPEKRDCREMERLLLLFLATLLTTAFSADFSDLFRPGWAPDHVTAQGETLQLKLDNTSGCGFESKRKYLFGRASVQIRLVEGDSAGTVTAFYMSSDGPYHDEVDFEFLGNVSGEPYLVQTNVYVNGTGNREQRHTLWFDPTADFHTYSLLWNRHRITFLIDGIPIRMFANKEDIGVPYAKNQGMGIYGSLWNADDWATQGGRVKTNWEHSPFISTFRSFEVDACEYVPETDDAIGKCKEGSNYWWNRPAMDGLSLHQSHQLRWVRRKHLVYDYCKDKARFIDPLKECLG